MCEWISEFMNLSSFQMVSETESRSVVTWGWDWEQGWTASRSEGIWRGNRNVSTLDCGDRSSMCKFTKKHWVVVLQMIHFMIFKLYVNIIVKLKSESYIWIKAFKSNYPWIYILGLPWWLRQWKNLPAMLETWVWSLGQENPSIKLLKI